MAECINIIGETGTGKTSSFENLNPSETAILLATRTKRLPWRGWKEKYIEGQNLYYAPTLLDIEKILSGIAATKPHIKTVCVDDVFMSITETVGLKGDMTPQKWGEFANECIRVLLRNIQKYRNDLTVVICYHTIVKEVNGEMLITLALPGNAVINAKPLGYVDYVLHTAVKVSNNGAERSFAFMTNTDGIRVAKSPKGALPFLMPNDMSLVLKYRDDFDNGIDNGFEAAISKELQAKDIILNKTALKEPPKVKMGIK